MRQLKGWMAALLLLPALAGAAELDEKFYNPQPLEGDVILSMPCNMRMAFRKVYTSRAPGRLSDHKFTAGSPDSASTISQSPNIRYIQGSFHDRQGYYYLMAKYEMTQLQYEALMADKCPQPGNKLRYPVVSISWFDAVEAARRYSQYLASAADTPAEGEVKAFARLPTDSEYEFALRGGLAVGQAQFEAATFVSEGSLRDYAWHAGANSSNGKLNLGGRLKPNPLGIFDLLGNAQEMTSDAYYITRTGRLHGQPGGFTARGGSFLTSAADMTSALRVERPYFLNGRESSAKDLGMRLVLALPVLTNMHEVDSLNAEAAALEADDGSADAAALARLGEIIRHNQEITDRQAKTEAENNSLQQRNQELVSALGELRLNMVRAQDERDEMRRRAVANNLRSGGLICMNVANARIMREGVEATIRLAQSNPAVKLDEDRMQRLQDRLRDEQAGEDFLTLFFANQVAETRGLYSAAELEAGLDSALQSVEGQGHNNQIGQYIKIYLSELKAYQQNSDLQSSLQKFNDKCYSLTAAARKAGK